MRNLKIGTRLGLGFGLIIILLLIMSGIGAWRMMSSHQDNEVLQARQNTKGLMLQWARQVDVNANQALAAANLTNPDVLQVFKKGLESSDKLANRLRDEIGADIQEPKAQDLYQQAIGIQKAYIDGRAKAFDELDRGDYDAADAYFNKAMPEITARYIGKIDELIDLQTQHVEALVEQTNAENNLGLTILAVATLLALILGPLFSWLVTRSVTHPLRHAVDLASAVAQRDLSHNVHADGKDEIGQLLRALSLMITNLRETVSEVHQGSDSIAAASAQITAGNLDLSSRTEQQASSLAQTAATMEEITATVRQNADNTQQANTLAAAAAKTATNGGTVVTELVNTMGEINAKSQQVADIISVIDSIAFQTNILALNAAVEAARAGEQGRGFAVVASEVRALAQRSASAAKEIKALIDTSVDATTKGNEQAARAGATMQEIVDGINRVTDIMGEINAANREQSTGIEEINTAITQMDDVTRQNASLVEESAAAATSLQSQADTLAALVSTFDLGDTLTDETAASRRGAYEEASAAQPAATQAPRLPAAPEKVISPAPSRPHREPPAAAKPATAAKPALRAPGRPAADENEEWTEF